MDLRCKSAMYRLFVSRIHPYILETTLSVSSLEKILYIQTDRVMNKVELDNSVNIYKAADALHLFVRNAAKRID